MVLTYSRLGGATAWMNRQTAGFCHDIEGPKEFHQPKSRVVIRFLLTLFVCLISVSLVLLFLFTQEPTFRTVRHWDDTYALKQFSPFLASRNASLDPIYKEKSAATICPCSNTTFTWNSFVDFFTIQYNPPQNPVRSSMITNGTEFCLNSIKSLPLNSSHVSRVGCPNMVNAAVNKANSRTFLSSASLMDPVLLNSTIQRSVLGKKMEDYIPLLEKGNRSKQLIQLRHHGWR